MFNRALASNPALIELVNEIAARGELIEQLAATNQQLSERVRELESRGTPTAIRDEDAA